MEKEPHISGCLFFNYFRIQCDLNDIQSNVKDWESEKLFITWLIIVMEESRFYYNIGSWWNESKAMLLCDKLKIQLTMSPLFSTSVLERFNTFLCTKEMTVCKHEDIASLLER